MSARDRAVKPVPGNCRWSGAHLTPVETAPLGGPLRDVAGEASLNLSVNEVQVEVVVVHESQHSVFNERPALGEW